MSEPRYWPMANAATMLCHDCGAVVYWDHFHDAFHDRIDRLADDVWPIGRTQKPEPAKTRITEADIEQHARDMFGSGNPDTPPSAENPDKPYGNSGSMNRDAVFAPPKDAVLRCAACGEPVSYTATAGSPPVIAHVNWLGPDHAATLTPPERKHDPEVCNCEEASEPPVGSGWFADKWPGVLWMRYPAGWTDSKRHAIKWPDLLPGRPAVPEERP